MYLSQSQLCFASKKIDAHPCAMCNAPMGLTRGNTARLAGDVHTCECFKCDNVDKVMIETTRRSTLSALIPTADEQPAGEAHVRAR